MDDAKNRSFGLEPFRWRAAGSRGVTVAVVIVAAGRGRRLGGDTPKQYIPLAGRCALRRSIEAFLKAGMIDWLVTVIHPDDRPLYETALDGLDDPRLLPAVEGGETRAESVRKGLERLEDVSPRHVLIHDAARPFVSERIIGDVLSALADSDGACAALPVVDALWTSDGNMAGAPVPRDGLWRAQTPQGFVFSSILSAHRLHDGTGADDVSVAREAGLRVEFVLGSEQNYKITTAADLRRAQSDVAMADRDA